MSGIRASFAALIPSLSESLSTSLAAIAVAATTHWLMFTMLAPFAWRVYLRLGARRMVFLRGLTTAAGFLMVTVSPGPIGVVVGFGLIAGAGTHGFDTLTRSVTLVGLHQRERDRLLALVGSGAPIGTATFPAFTALVLVVGGPRVAAAAAAVLLLLTTGTAGALLPSRDPEIVAPTGGRRRQPSVWRSRVFLLVALAFRLALGAQVAVPVMLPDWVPTIRSADVAIAFLVLDARGLLGRPALSLPGQAFPLRLWVVVTAAQAASAGCLLAFHTAGPPSAYIAVALLGGSLQLFGGLFAIATLACFPPSLFAPVNGSLLVPLGLAGAFATFAFTVAFERGVEPALIWAGLALFALTAGALFLIAEFWSPVRRARVG